MNAKNRETLIELDGLMTGRWITDLANFCALMNTRYADINWIGFYLVDSDPHRLWLGPFQGLPACTMIPLGKGVCGSAASSRTSVRVKNVDDFPGHIVCDSNSKSELVVPIVKENVLLGVLDVDSASLDRFSEDDQIFFEAAVKILISK